MSVRTVPVTNSINWRKLAAIVAQVASWFTTLWAVQWIWSEGPLNYQILVALLVEAFFVVLKERMFRGDDPALGWAGLALDTIVNAGGLLPKACRVLTFPPVAAVMAAFGAAGACTIYSPVSVGLAIAFGALLSVAPHRLWRA